jgi:hypothetical protein
MKDCPRVEVVTSPSLTRKERGQDRVTCRSSRWPQAAGRALATGNEVVRNDDARPASRATWNDEERRMRCTSDDVQKGGDGVVVGESESVDERSMRVWSVAPVSLDAGSPNVRETSEIPIAQSVTQPEGPLASQGLLPVCYGISLEAKRWCYYYLASA